MSEGLNKVMLIGNIGMPPELRETRSGDAVLNLRLATSEKYVTKDTGEKKEKTEWHTVTLFGKRAAALGRLLRKGERIYVEGSLETREYQGNDGVDRKRTNVKARDIILLGGTRDAVSARVNASAETDNEPDEDRFPF